MTLRIYFTINEQPCNKFEPQEGCFSHNEHQCPKCGGIRSFCLNCHKDHHKNGWDECWKIKERT